MPKGLGFGPRIWVVNPAARSNEDGFSVWRDEEQWQDFRDTLEERSVEFEASVVVIPDVFGIRWRGDRAELCRDDHGRTASGDYHRRLEIMSRQAEPLEIHFEDYLVTRTKQTYSLWDLRETLVTEIPEVCDFARYRRASFDDYRASGL